ncbi:MAG: hypothetical protein QOE98_294 [Gaiellaceae bacterium]|nr:hypothetical protein [Gaiellaceae bacterium]
MEASAPRAASAAVIRLFATMDNLDPALLKALEEGTYVVDPHAVADAILRRHEQLAEARRLSAVLVAAQVDDAAVRGMQPGDSAAGADVA